MTSHDRLRVATAARRAPRAADRKRLAARVWRKRSALPHAVRAWSTTTATRSCIRRNWWRARQQAPPRGVGAEEAPPVGAGSAGGSAGRMLVDPLDEGQG